MNRSIQIFKTLFLIGSIAFFVSSCKKDKETKDADIVGNWTISSATVSATIDGKSLSQYFLDLGTSSTEADQFAQAFNDAVQQSFTGTVNIKSDHTYTINSGGSSDGGTWALNSSGDKLTLDAGTADEATFDILSVDKNSLHIKFSQDQMDDLNGDGTDETIAVSVDMNLTK